jgi:hypothetical protein
VSDDASAPAAMPNAPGPAGDIVDPAEAVLLARAPRAGELAPGWRLVLAVAWLSVAVAIGAIWKTTDQLGMSTWWLGPRGEPRPAVVQILPFVPSVVMVLLSVNHVRRLVWWSLGASALVVAVGAVDLGYKPSIGMLEIAVGVAAALVSVASFAGTYRPIRTDTDTDTDTEHTPGSPAPAAA